MPEFHDKTVLVTGASSGIGWHTARLFADGGARVLAHYHTNEAGARSLGPEVALVQADLAGLSGVEKLEAAVNTEFGGRLDILVNNAGAMVRRARFLELDEELWDAVFDVNLKSVYRCCRAFLPGMLERKEGVVVIVSSIAAHNGGGPGASAYASTKGALLAFTKGLAREFAPQGIRVVGVAPGVIDTPFHDRFSTKAILETFARSVPLGRLGHPREVAETILFLASPRAGYLVGETVEVNGGMLMD